MRVVLDYACQDKEEALIREPKLLDTMPREVEIQLMNYPVATGSDVGLLINIGKMCNRVAKVRNNKKKILLIPNILLILSYWNIGQAFGYGLT